MARVPLQPPQRGKHRADRTGTRMARNRPYGEASRQSEMAKRLALSHTLRNDAGQRKQAALRARTTSCGRVALGGCPPRAPTDPYVDALDHTVPQVTPLLRQGCTPWRTRQSLSAGFTVTPL